MCKRLLAVRWSALKIDAQHKILVLNVMKDKPENTPGLDKDKWPNMAGQLWASSISTYYKTKPYFDV